MRRGTRWAVTAAAAIACALPARAEAQSGFGQSFTTGATNTFLQSVFTGSIQGSTAVGYTWELQALSGNTLTGPILFQQAVAGPVASNQTLNTRLQLAANSTYAFLLFNTGGGVLILSSGGSQIAGGTAVTCSTTTCTPQVGDVNQFALNLTSGPSTTTPEPASMTLLGTGVAGLIAARRRRRQAQAEPTSV